MTRLWAVVRSYVGRRVRAIVKQTIGPSDAERLQMRMDEGRVEIGRHTYGTPRIVMYRGDTGRVRIGAFCSIAEDVEIYLGGNHRHDWVSSFPFRTRFALPGAYEDGHPATKGDVVIGNDVWLGRGSTIFSGVTIGNGAVVGARAVVTKDVRPYAVVAGNPGREVARRFSDEQIARLERVEWWAWPDEKVLDRVPMLTSDKIDEFLDAAEEDKRTS